MALVERLCQIDPDEPGGEPYSRHMAIDPFIRAMSMILAYSLDNSQGHTVLEVKNFYSMTAADEAEFDAWIASVNTRTTLEEKMLAVQQYYAVLSFWERNSVHDPVPGYQTVAEIRAALNNI